MGLNHTKTAMGRRKLRTWIAQPMVHAGPIQRRLDAVQRIAERQVSSQLSRLLGSLRTIPDLEAVAGRVAAGRCDCASLVSCLRACEAISVTASGIDATGKIEMMEEDDGEDDDVSSRGQDPTSMLSQPSSSSSSSSAASASASSSSSASGTQADTELIQSLFRSKLLNTTRSACVSALGFISEQAGGVGTNPSSTKASSAASTASKAQAAAAAAFRGSRGARFAAAALRKTLKTVNLSESLSVEAAESAFPDVAEARSCVSAGLAALEQDLLDVRHVLDKPTLEFRSLRTGVSASVEFLIELTKRDAARGKVPSDWITVSSTSQFTRFHTPAVLEHMEALARARESLVLACETAWQSLLERLSASLVPVLRDLAESIAELDALASLAHLAGQPGYCRPIILKASVASAGVWAVAARHPVAELAGQTYAHASLASTVSTTSGSSAAGSVTLSGVYVPNPIALGERPTTQQLVAASNHAQEAERIITTAIDSVGANLRCAVLTGPNMNGKSSYARCGALLAIMAQLGSFVPAEACVVSPCDGVYTRMGSSDDLEGGMSTFMVEMSQSAAILQVATRRSLVIMDELGRGTATHDGTALAQATLEHTVTKLQCPAIFITHFPELSSAAEALARSGHPVGNLHMAFLERSLNTRAEAVVFLYRVRCGPAGKSYGLNVARMAGIPAQVIGLAQTWSTSLHQRVMMGGDIASKSADLVTVSADESKHD